VESKGERVMKSVKNVWFEPIVEKDIPLPKPKEPYHSFHDIWISMEVGDSILFPSYAKWETFKRQAGLFNPDRNHTSRKDPDTGTIRVWKLTDVETVRYARIRQKKENK
jgi:hypothetical protein